MILNLKSFKNIDTRSIDRSNDRWWNFIALTLFFALDWTLKWQQCNWSNNSQLTFSLLSRSVCCKRDSISFRGHHQLTTHTHTQTDCITFNWLDQIKSMFRQMKTDGQSYLLQGSNQKMKFDWSVKVYWRRKEIRWHISSLSFSLSLSLSLWTFFPYCVLLTL